MSSLEPIYLLPQMGVPWAGAPLGVGGVGP